MASEWDEFQDAPDDPWAEFKDAPQEKQPSTLGKLQANPNVQTAVRSTVRMLTSPAALFMDTLNGLYNLPAYGLNKLAGTNLPYAPSSTDYYNAYLPAIGVDPTPKSTAEKVVTALGGAAMGGAAGLRAAKATGAIADPTVAKALDVPRNMAASGATVAGTSAGTELADEWGVEDPVARFALEMGGGLAASAVGVPMVLGAVEGGRRMMSLPTRGGKEEIAGRLLLAQATSPDVARARAGNAELAQEFVRGSKPTLAEVTQDPGLARMQRVIASSPAAIDAGVDQVNAVRNTVMDDAIHAELARVNGVNTPRYGDLAGAMHRQKQRIAEDFIEGSPDLRTLQVSTPTMQNTIARLYSQHEGKPQIMSMIAAVEKELMAGSLNLPAGNSFQQVWNQRQHIDDIIYEKLRDVSGGSKAQLRQVGQELRRAMNDDLKAAVPGFDQFLKDYSRRERIEGAMELGREIGGKMQNTARNIASGADDIYGSRQISGAKADNLDLDALQRKAGSQLTNAQRRVLEGVQEEKRRANILTTGGAPGNSNTAQNIAVDSLIQRDIARGIFGDAPGAAVNEYLANLFTGAMGVPSRVLARSTRDEVLRMVAAGMLDPAEGARLMGKAKVTGPMLSGKSFKEDAARSVLGDWLRRMGQ